MVGLEDEETLSIKAKQVSFFRGQKAILSEINLEITQGKILGVIGPNGSGKSTLLSLLAGDFLPTEGNITYEDNDIKNLSFIDRAKRRSVLSQSQKIMFNYTVNEIISMGIVEGYGIKTNDSSQIKLQTMIGLFELDDLVNRDIRTLSGGEQQRVHIARSIIQIWNRSIYTEPRFILLDEPTSNLDLAQEIKILKIIKKEVKKGLGAMIIFHDLNLTAHFADKIAMLSDGKIIEYGIPKSVLKPSLLEKVYGIKMKIYSEPFHISHF